VPVRLLFGERKNPNAKIMDSFLRSQADEWRERNNVNEVLLVTHDGFITEGSRSNVFFIKDNTLITAPSDKVLQGIARKHIFAICAENNIEIKEELVHYTKLERMQAAFLSGTSRRVLPINKIDHHHFNTTHPLLKQLHAWFEERVKRYIRDFGG
jgi:branched-chain amino acid aminotransferase